MSSRTEYTYEAETHQLQRLCDVQPFKVTVSLMETVTTTTRHDDRSTTTHETRPRCVAQWTYAPEDDTTGPTIEGTQG